MFGDRAKMKFNEKELALWASSFASDKEGLLEKKGAGRGQGYRQRWFRLKGNLLFYFKVNEYGDWESTSGEPLGVILLERCQVNRTHHETRPFTFVLAFENDDSRCYDLSAQSEKDMNNWMKAISTASYEGLRATLYKLQNKLISATGEDPLKDKGMHVSIIGPGGGASPKPKIKTNRVRRSAYVRASSKERAQRLNSLTLHPPHQGPQYELSFSCSKLPMGDNGKPPSTLLRTSCYANQRDSTAHYILSQSEIVESSCSPCYSHLLLLEVGPTCPPTSFLRFEVFAVDNSQTVKEADPSFKLDSESVGKCIGVAEYSIRAIMTSMDSREVKLNLSSEKNIVCGFLHVTPVKLDEKLTGSPRTPRRNAMSPLDRGSPIGILPTIMAHPVRCHFSFTSEQARKLKVIEEMAECVFNVQIPIELLKCYIREDNTVLQDLYSIGALDESWVIALSEYQAILFDSIASYQHALKDLESVASTCGFKPSVQKKDETLRFVPCNLHIQRMRVQSDGKEKVYSVVTSGCPADHVTGFKGGGLRRILSECRSSPSFISKWTKGKASIVKHSLARLNEIRTNVSQHKNILFRACANASPLDMNEAMIGISKEIQQLLYLMQSGVVTDSIEGLITARPGGGETPVPLSPPSKDMKRLSMKRKSAMVGGVRCSCGKCLICIPSPCDWAWNGSSFVQVSTREWKLDDSCESIQQSLMALVEAVETATKRVVEQQHEAVAKEVGYGLSTYTPTYVWSSNLIPLFTQLSQTVDGLCKVAISSLSFSLVQLDSYVQGLQVLKRRRDVVFAQALASLVTSFYLLLSHNFLDAKFLRQIREIGFLAQFESLLSSMGDECGMLEDMCVAVAELANVSFQLTEKTEKDLPFDFHINGTRDALTIQFMLAREYIAALPDDMLRAGRLISVVPVLFTQGVNEKQTLAKFKQQIQLQDDINHRGLGTLSTYVEKYTKIMSKSETSQASLEVVKIKDLLDLLKKSYASHKSKNVEFLITLEQLCRRLNGGRLTSCKSGKDRTSMSVTLEECSLLRTNHHLDSDAFFKTLATLRSHGTRLENCQKNTGHRCYHFNHLQLMLLPKLLAPPPNTCRDPE